MTCYNDCHVTGFRRAIAQFTEGIEIDPDDAEAYKDRGDVYFLKAEYNRALADYSKAIELDPDDEHAYLSRGTVYVAKGNSAGALADFAEALQLNPDDISDLTCASVDAIEAAEATDAEGGEPDDRVPEK